MKQAFVLLMLLIGLFHLGYLGLGYEAMYQVAYGAITLMALMISGTFLWLFVQRATPLALGMAYGWAGAGLVLGWWYLYHLTGRPGWAVDSPVLFVILPFYFVGAVLHFAVIHRSFGRHGMSFLWPVALSVVVSSLLYLLF
jgi:hypothetical protein